MTVEVELPDGTVLEFPDGMSQDDMRAAINRLTQTTPEAGRMAANRERIAAARAGKISPTSASLDGAAAMDQRAYDNIVLANEGAFGAGISKVAQGLPFVGQYMDEAAGAVNAGIGAVTGWKDPAQARQETLDRARAVQGAMDREYPKTSAGLNIAGGLLGVGAMAKPIAAAGKAIGAVVPGSLVGKAALGAVAAGSAGAIEGAVSGYGAGNDGDRSASARTGAMIGGSLGAALGAAAPLASAGIKAAAEAFKGRDVSTVARVLGIDKGAARVVRDALNAEDFPAAQAALKRAGADAMLADAGDAAGQLLDTAAQTGGKALVTARTAVDARAAQAASRLTNTLDGVLGKVEGVKAASKSIATRTAGIRQAAYDRAYGTAINYADDAGRNIESVLSRIPANTLKSAVSEANDAMQAAGVRNMQIMAEIAPNGSVVFREMPNVQQLDEIKKALDAIARNGTDAVTGKMSSEAVRASSLARQLREAVVDAVPSYKTAVKLGGDKIAEDTALNLGRTALSPSVTRETIINGMKDASRDAIAAAKRGLRSTIDETLANVKTSLTGPEEIVMEARRALRDMTSRAAREKMAAILGDAQAGRLFSALDEMSAHLELQAGMASNSKTAIRTAGRDAVDAVTAPNALGSLMQGNVGEATRKLIQFFTGATGEAQVAAKQEIYAQIADALTRIKGPQAEAALATMRAAIGGQPMKTADAVRIARVLTTGLALGGYQTGQKVLSRP